jgi:hypothetical protein
MEIVVSRGKKFDRGFTAYGLSLDFYIDSEALE